MRRAAEGTHSFGVLFVLLIVSYSCIIFLLDYLFPLGCTVSALYSLIILASSFILSEKKKLYAIVAWCSLLLLLGFFLSPDSSELWMRISGRVVILCVIWMGGAMGAMFIQINLREKILERKFHIAIEAAPTAMLMIDENGRMILVNKQMESLFGYTRKELLKLNVDSLLPEKFRHAHPAHRRHFLQNPEARKMGGGRELFGLKKDGLEIPVEIGLMPVRTPEGEFVIGSIIDISERKAAQTLIEKKNKQLAVVNDELSQFAYRTSHDLKAPLVTMQGLARYIEKDIQTGNLGEALENVRKILFQSERLSGLVTDILDLSKADLEDAGEEAVDFDKLIEEMREKFAILTAGNHVEVVYNNQLSGSFVSQTSRVRQIVENLVSNGIKYCNPKQVQKYVRVHLLEKPEAVVLIVADNGLGVPEQRKGDLFRMFKRFHPNVSFGSGLGMSIVKKHVDRLGGSIQLASSGEGTCVEVCFPRNGKVGEI